MSIQLCVLASGSSGNASVLRTPSGLVMIDCGIGPRIAAARLVGTGASLSDISAICLTHLDRDHFNPNWISTILRSGIRVFCAAERVEDLCAMAGSDAFTGQVYPFDSKPFDVLPGLEVQCISVAHDQDGSHAFVFEGFGVRVGYATDLGRVPPRLIEQFCGIDLLAIESNYDPQMQRTSGRPWFLQQRITGGRGHLSNAQALAAVREIFQRCAAAGHELPQQVVLLHRSQQCNCPRLVRELFSHDARLASRLILTEQHVRTEWISPTPAARFLGKQLSLAFG